MSKQAEFDRDTGDIRLRWRKDGDEILVTIPPPTISQIEGYFDVIHRLNQKQAAKTIDLDNPDGAGALLEVIRQNREAASALMLLSDHPEYAQKAGELPHFLGLGGWFWRAILTHWTTDDAPLPSGATPNGRPTLTPVPELS